MITDLRTDDDHRAALREIESLWDAQPGTEAYDRLSRLATLVEAYECRPLHGEKKMNLLESFTPSHPAPMDDDFEFPKFGEPGD
jgi:hypothetical protein